MGKRKRPQDLDNTSAVQQTSTPGKRAAATAQATANKYTVQQQQQQLQQQNETVAVANNNSGVGQTYYVQQGGGQRVVQVENSSSTSAPVAASTNLVTYKCIKCQQIFESKPSFLEHCNQYHYFACDLCSNCLFDDLVQLNVHMIKHLNKYDKPVCEKCNMLCSSSEELKAHLGNHITTYNRSDVIFTSAEDDAVLEQQQHITTNSVVHQQPVAVASNGGGTLSGTVPLSSVLNDDSLIEHLASELDQSIGSTVKIKPQKYRCGVCKQDFSDPRLLFKHMNHVHINFPLQVQQQAPPPAPPSPPPQPVIHHHHHQISQQPTATTLSASDNVVYTNLSTDNIYYDERTGQYYTIALMDHSPPLAETPGSQSVIEYVQDTSGMGESVEYVTTNETGETIIVEEAEDQKVVLTDKVAGSHEPPPPLVQITRETDLEELIPTTTLVAADEPPPVQTTITRITKSVQAPVTSSKQQQQQSSEMQLQTKCVNCSSIFTKKFPKQMYCHACVARNTQGATLSRH